MDNFASSGPKDSFDWFVSELRKRHELTEVARLGPGSEDDRESKILNRGVRWTNEGFEHEADPCLAAAKLVRELTLDGARSVGTPGVKPRRLHHQEDRPIDVKLHSAYRAIAAMSNYSAVDRPEIQFAAKERCRWMAAPTELGMVELKRLGRFIEGHRALVVKYP